MLSQAGQQGSRGVAVIVMEHWLGLTEYGAQGAI